MQPPRLLAGIALASVLVAGTAMAQPQQPTVPAAPAAAPAQRSPAARWRPARKRTQSKFDVVATYPGFRMLPDGGSRVVLELSRKVDVSELKAEGRVTYRMKGVGAPTRTNRLPLLTAFFRTPVARVQLVEGREELDLVIDLRAPSTFSHRIVEKEGGAVLMIDFTAPPGGAVNAAIDAPRKPTQPTKRIEAQGDSSF